jgi:DNA invertase Pin-like site-specific DNA recombinase
MARKSNLTEKERAHTPDAVLYARVSSREQAEGYSIEAQVKLLRAFAEREGLRVVREFIDVETAKKVGRPEFGEMLAFLKTHPSAQNLLVEKTDRLYRNFKDYVALDELALEIHLVKEGTRLSHASTSHDKFIHGIKVLMAKNYIDNLREEVTKGMLEKATKGLPPGRPPVGYRNNKDSRGIDIDPIQGQWVKKMFEAYATRAYSLARLSQFLFEEGYTFQPSKPKIPMNTLEKVLKNPFYIGRFHFAGQPFTGTYPHLISDALFKAVQAAFRARNRPKQQKHTFAFTGLLTCEECGCAITAEMKKGKYVYYHCTHRRGECSQKAALREEELDRQFEAVVGAVEVEPEVMEEVEANLAQTTDEDATFQKEKTEAVTKRIEALENRLERGLEAHLDGGLPDALWKKKSREWEEEIARLRASLRPQAEPEKIELAPRQGFGSLAKKASALYRIQSPIQKRTLLNILCSRSTLRDGRIRVTYRRPFDLMAVREAAKPHPEAL